MKALKTLKNPAFTLNARDNEEENRPCGITGDEEVWRARGKQFGLSFVVFSLFCDYLLYYSSCSIIAVGL